MILLETSRLRLRRFTPDDADLLVELDSDPVVMRYITFGAPTPREAYVNTCMPRWFEIYAQYPLLGYWAAERLADGEFFGWFHLRDDRIEPAYLELGYRLRRAGTFVYPGSIKPGHSDDERRAFKYELSRAEWRAGRA